MSLPIIPSYMPEKPAVITNRFFYGLLMIRKRLSISLHTLGNLASIAGFVRLPKGYMHVS